MTEETNEPAQPRRGSRRLAGQKKENTQPGNKSNVSTKERMGFSFKLKLKLRGNESNFAVRGSSPWTSPIMTIPKSKDNSLPSSRSDHYQDNHYQDSGAKIVNAFQQSAATAINSAGYKVRVSLASYYKTSTNCSQSCLQSFHTMRSDEDSVGLDPAMAMPTQSTGPPHKRHVSLESFSIFAGFS